MLSPAFPAFPQNLGQHSIAYFFRRPILCPVTGSVETADSLRSNSSHTPATERYLNRAILQIKPVTRYRLDGCLLDSFLLLPAVFSGNKIALLLTPGIGNMQARPGEATHDTTDLDLCS